MKIFSKGGDIVEEFSKQQHLIPKGPFAKIFLILIFLVILISIMFATCFTYVAPNEYGIKQVKIGPSKGIQKKAYETGLHWVTPILAVMHTFPKDYQTFELTAYPPKPIPPHRGYIEIDGVTYTDAANIQLSDAFYVDVDVAIIARITDPYKVIDKFGPRDQFKISGILPKAEPKLKITLGELNTEEFYNSKLRVVKQQKARDLLNDELEPNGIKIEHVLVRYFKYKQDIQERIERKKLEDQLVFTNRAKEKAGEQQAELSRVIEEGEANFQVRLEGGKAYRTRKNAERDKYVRMRNAEANLEVKKAEAMRTELIRKAYEQEGFEKYYGLKMADVYKGIDLIILPSDTENGFNPLAINEVLELFGVYGEPAKGDK